MLQKIAMTRRFICHHGMLQPLRWLDVRSTVVVGQRCHFSTEKCNKFTMPQLPQGRSSHLGWPSTQQPWIKTWYCQVRRLGEDVCAPRVAAQTGNGSAFFDSSAWQVCHTDEDLNDEKQNHLRNELWDARTNDQNGKRSDNQLIRRRLGHEVMWRDLRTSSTGTWPSVKAAARELSVSPGKIARCCKEGCQIRDFQVEFKTWLPMKKGREEKTDQTEQGGWMVSNYGRFRNSRGRLTYGMTKQSGYHMVSIFGEWFYAHRVVALTFHGPPPNQSAWQVHHRDGDPSNNRAENLTFVTSAENIQNSYSRSSRGHAGRAVSRPVLCKHMRTSQVVLFPSLLSAARQLDVSEGVVVRRCQAGSPIRDYQVEFAPPAEPELLQGERWLPMIDPETLLKVPGRQVSSYGRIKSQRGSRDLITRGHQTKSGYFTAAIQGQRIKTVGIHRLVVFAFLGPPPSPMHSQVNHKDMDRGNNRVENLEYVTRSENMQHYYANRAGSTPVGTNAVLGRPGDSEEKWVLYPSVTKAAENLGIGRSGISRCARGLSRQTRGYEFRFALARSEEPAHLPGEEWRPLDLEVLRRDKAERKGMSKQGRNGGKTSTWNSYPDMSGMVENNAFPPGVSIHVPLILETYHSFLMFFCAAFHESQAPKRHFVTHGAVLGCGQPHEIQDVLLESWKGAPHNHMDRLSRCVLWRVVFFGFGVKSTFGRSRIFLVFVC